VAGRGRSQEEVEEERRRETGHGSDKIGGGDPKGEGRSEPFKRNGRAMEAVGWDLDGRGAVGRPSTARDSTCAPAFKNKHTLFASLDDPAKTFKTLDR